MGVLLSGSVNVVSSLYFETWPLKVRLSQTMIFNKSICDFLRSRDRTIEQWLTRMGGSLPGMHVVLFLLVLSQDPTAKTAVCNWSAVCFGLALEDIGSTFHHSPQHSENVPPSLACIDNGE